MEIDYPSFTNSGFGTESIIISQGEYILLNMVDKTSRPLGKTSEEARMKLREIKMEHLEYLLP
ncbi:hypothetical protein SOV_44270 [Sporomusa ovata DSM 2662]|uniref:Uncharacterized protein n=1 Tax=Sporomusa ovata TaxID=2378 RepID=A0A0U1KU16_9FIRM|nr:hypothetical protein [Sporomusa ovata]EQB26815.1 hypothetical protein SOV_3c06890 [Sporomusa ovata DSM 2662]CQR70916.1 hypothetical protein SpAn4DRAFT_1894 [Sporomusa ovata]